MKLHISFKQINSDYSQDYANQYNFGEESYNNQKYHWAISFEINEEVDKISINKNQNVIFNNFIEDGKHYDLVAKKVTLIQIYKRDKVYAQYVISDELLDNIHEVYKEKTDKKYCYFYLRDNIEFVNIKEHTYIIEDDITVFRQK